MLMKSYVGETFRTNQCGNIVLVEFLGYKFEHQQEYLVEFVDTGTRVPALISAIKKGQVSDYNAKSVIGIGYLGRKQPNKATKEYSRLKLIWSNMLHRCYDRKSISYKSYGAKGVTVCERWHSFANFCDDVIALEGWNADLFVSKAITLDKDKFGTSMLYAKEYCCWLTMREQNDHVRHTIHKFTVMWPDGKTEYWDKGIAAFCTENPQFTATSISACLKGRRQTNHRCKFYHAEYSLQ